MTTISIAMTTYNGQRFVEELLNSLLAQTRKPDEVIIFDDSSIDNTSAIVNDFIEKHNLFDTWKFTINKKNKGSARNFIDVSLATKGDIIFFCDQDDIWDNQKLQKMTEIMDENTDINLLCSNLEPFYYEKGARKWDKKALDDMTNDGSLEKQIFNLYNFFCRRSGCTMCIRRSFLNEISPFWTNNWGHDDFVWKTATVTDSCAILQYCSIKRRMHANNTSSIKERTREWRINQIQEMQEQTRSLRKYAVSKGANSQKVAIIDRNLKCLELRLSLLNKRNIVLWFVLYIKYRKCFVRNKALFLDLYLTLFSKYRGVN